MFKNMAAKFSTQTTGVDCFFLRDVLPLAFTIVSICDHTSEHEFFSQIAATLPQNAIGIVANLETFKISVFQLRKKMGFVEENWKYLKIDKDGKVSVECVSNGIFSKECLFRHTYEVFLAKNQKKLKLEKQYGMLEEECFFREKKRWLPFKSLLHINRTAQNMPLVAGCLVISSLNESFKFQSVENWELLIYTIDTVKWELRINNSINSEERTFLQVSLNSRELNEFCCISEKHQSRFWKI